MSKFINIDNKAYNVKYIESIYCDENRCNIQMFRDNPRCLGYFYINKKDNYDSYHKLKNIYDKTINPIVNDEL